jgi:carbon storage regulator CsrA
MLVLGRKENESIRIGDRIKITVREVVGNRVKLAFDAPKWITIRREEVPAREIAVKEKNESEVQA